MAVCVAMLLVCHLFVSVCCCTCVKAAAAGVKQAWRKDMYLPGQ